METVQTRAHFSIPSLIAIAAAIVSFFVSPGSGFILAMVAIAFGVIGFLLSFSPSIRGGVISFFSMFLAGIAIVVAIIKALIH